MDFSTKNRPECPTLDRNAASRHGFHELVASVPLTFGAMVPGHHYAFDDRHGLNQRDADNGQNSDRREHTCCVEHALRAQDDVAEPALRRDEFADDSAY